MEKHQLDVEKARRHIKFCCQIYRQQMSQGMYSLHEDPWFARSWHVPEIDKIAREASVRTLKRHMCQLGMTAVDPKLGQEDPILEPTTNSFCEAKVVGRTCTGGHAHTKLLCGRAAVAATYPPSLCDAICLGIRGRRNMT